MHTVELWDIYRGTNDANLFPTYVCVQDCFKINMHATLM